MPKIVKISLSVEELKLLFKLTLTRALELTQGYWIGNESRNEPGNEKKPEGPEEAEEDLVQAVADANKEHLDAIDAAMEKLKPSPLKESAWLPKRDEQYYSTVTKLGAEQLYKSKK